MNMPVRLVLTLGVMVLLCSQAMSTERWVPSPNYPTIQSAIDACVDGDEVIIEPNTYTGAGNRDLDPNALAITIRSIDPNDPNVVAATVIDCGGDANDLHRAFDFHRGEDANSVVAGLTIVNGYADYGGGIRCSSNSGPTIINCAISGNSAWRGGAGIVTAGAARVIRCAITGNTVIVDERSDTVGYGGGVLNWRYGSQTITNCTIMGNAITGGEHIVEEVGGGGVYNDVFTDVTITNCTITGNTITADVGWDLYIYGAGVASYLCHNVSITNCTISGNTISAWGWIYLQCGAGIYNDATSLTMTNCTISGNTIAGGGPGYGGGLLASGDETVTGCTIAGNTARSLGGGVYSAPSSYDGGRTLVNCVVWQNTDEYGMGESAQIRGPAPAGVTYTCIQGCAGYCADANDHNIGDDPVFVDPNGPDGDPNTWQDNDYHLSPNSPCINAGDPDRAHPGQTDIDGEPRVMGGGGRVDMGSDEFPGTPFYSLAVKVKPLSSMGSVLIDPNDPNWVRKMYPSGTVVRLTQEPAGNSVFKKWRVLDLCHPEDANYPVIDTNSIFYLTMDRDWHVKAIFTCGGGGIAPFLAIMLATLGLYVLVRRRT